MLAEKSQDINTLHNKPRKAKKKKNRKKKSNRMGNFKSILLAIVFLVGCLAVLSRYATITGIRSDINELEGTIEALDKEKMNLEAKLEGIKSSDQIAKDAMINLGMHYPRKDQIMYVSIDNTHRKKDSEAGGIKDTMKTSTSKVKGFIGGLIGE